MFIRDPLARATHGVQLIEGIIVVHYDSGLVSTDWNEYQSHVSRHVRHALHNYNLEGISSGVVQCEIYFDAIKIGVASIVSIHECIVALDQVVDVALSIT
jgi:hypothetical protein